MQELQVHLDLASLPHTLIFRGALPFVLQAGLLQPRLQESDRKSGGNKREEML